VSVLAGFLSVLSGRLFLVCDGVFWWRPSGFLLCPAFSLFVKFLTVSAGASSRNV
jgi:hypothetical protein